MKTKWNWLVLICGLAVAGLGLAAWGCDDDDDNDDAAADADSDADGDSDADADGDSDTGSGGACPDPSPACADPNDCVKFCGTAKITKAELAGKGTLCVAILKACPGPGNLSPVTIGGTEILQAEFVDNTTEIQWSVAAVKSSLTSGQGWASSGFLKLDGESCADENLQPNMLKVGDPMALQCDTGKWNGEDEISGIQVNLSMKATQLVIDMMGE